jgi:thioredoxin-dependent peroxiredoxin
MSTLLQANRPAPGFRAENPDRQSVALEDFLPHRRVVLYFYPKDDTPGCTIEANDFTALAAEFAALDTVVIGVSKDDCASHRAFVDKYGLNVLLLADNDGSICQRYGVWQEVEKNGVKQWRIVRSTFVINRQGLLAEALYAVDPQGHAADILEKVRALRD